MVHLLSSSKSVPTVLYCGVTDCCFSLLYIEEDLMSDVGKGHKSEGDGQSQANAQVKTEQNILKFRFFH